MEKKVSTEVKALARAMNRIDAQSAGDKLSAIFIKIQFPTLKLRQFLNCELGRWTAVYMRWESNSAFCDAVTKLESKSNAPALINWKYVLEFLNSATLMDIRRTPKEIKTLTEKGLKKETLGKFLSEADSLSILFVFYVDGLLHFAAIHVDIGPDREPDITDLRKDLLRFQKDVDIRDEYKEKHQQQFPTAYLPKMDTWQKMQLWCMDWCKRYIHTRIRCFVCEKPKAEFKCPKCQVIRYCSVDCQTKHWKGEGGHKKSCASCLEYARSVVFVSETSMYRLAVAAVAPAPTEAKVTDDPPCP